MALSSEDRNSTLLSNIAGNLIAMGRGGRSVAPGLALRNAEQQTLANRIMGNQNEAFEQQQMAAQQAEAIRPQIDAVLANTSLTYEQKVAKLSQFGPYGQQAINELGKRIKQQQEIAKGKQEAELGNLTKEQKFFLDNPEQYAAMKKAGASSSTSPYYTPIQTADGVFAFDNRTGNVGRPVYAGDAIVGSSSDPGLQGSIAQAKEIGTKKGTEDQELYEMVSSAPPKLQKLDKVLGLLESSDTITGLGAEALMQLERAKVMFGGDADKLNRTQLLDVMLGADVFPMIKDLGIGARGMDTPAERDYMRQVLTGQIKLEKDVLVEMTKIRKRLIQAAVDKWDSRVDNGELDRWSKATGIEAKKYGTAAKDVVQPQPLNVQEMTDEQILELY